MCLEWPWFDIPIDYGWIPRSCFLFAVLVDSLGCATRSEFEESDVDVKDVS